MVPNNNRKINDLNYSEIIENKNRKLNKSDVLKQLKEHKNDIKTFSIKKTKSELIKKKPINREEDIKNKILNVLNSYSEQNIKNEWESMRKVWYQNNQRFNPIFKINDKIEKKEKNVINEHKQIPNRGNPTNNNGKDGNNIFSNVQNVKTNQ